MGERKINENCQKFEQWNEKQPWLFKNWRLHYISMISHFNWHSIIITDDEQKVAKVRLWVFVIANDK